MDALYGLRMYAPPFCMAKGVHTSDMHPLYIIDDTASYLSSPKVPSLTKKRLALSQLHGA